MLHFPLPLERIVFVLVALVGHHVTDRMPNAGDDFRPVVITTPTLGSIPTRLWQLKQAEEMVSAADRVGERG